MKIVFAAGGTGGHVYPALALADYLQELDSKHQSIFIGSKTRIESKIISKSNYPFIGLNIPSMYNLKTKLKVSMLMPFAFLKAYRVLKKENPDIVFGTGGFISYPTVKAAQFLKIPTILHEQNAVMGKANLKLLANSKALITCYPNVLKNNAFDKTYYLGNPRASQLASLLKPTTQTYDVLIFMGSQGSLAIDNIIRYDLEKLSLQNFKTLYVCGEAYLKNYNQLQIGNLTIKGYDDNLIETMQKSKIIVCRAGATSIAELSVLAHPLVLIPSIHVVDNHQFLNANGLANQNACKLILEEGLTCQKLIDSLNELLSNDKLQSEMTNNIKSFAKPNASKDIYNLINEMVGEINGKN